MRLLLSPRTPVPNDIHVMSDDWGEKLAWMVLASLDIASKVNRMNDERLSSNYYHS